MVAIGSKFALIWNLVLITVVGSSTRKVAFIWNTVLIAVWFQFTVVGSLIAVAIVPAQLTSIRNAILVAIV